MKITYAVEKVLDPDEFVDILKRSTLAQRRPLKDRRRVVRMCRYANLIVTARDEKGKLVGLARSLTDFALCCYLSDLAVDRKLQRKGIGRELVSRTQEAAGGEEVMLLLVSAPAAMDYYPKIGLRRFDNAFGIALER
jgi:GNAT superfamily N-acetyltransferase